MLYYRDRSAIVKLYVEETGSNWLENLIDRTPPGQLFISALAGIEVLSALTRKFPANEIQTPDYRIASDEFLSDYHHLFVQISISAEIISNAITLLSKYFLRAYDSLQLVTAVKVLQLLEPNFNQKITFLCADKQLPEIAQKEGLLIENPNDYTGY